MPLALRVPNVCCWEGRCSNICEYKGIVYHAERSVLRFRLCGSRRQRTGAGVQEAHGSRVCREPGIKRHKPLTDSGNLWPNADGLFAVQSKVGR